MLNRMEMRSPRGGGRGLKLLLAAAVSTPGMVVADDLSSILRFDGFATIGVVHLDRDDADFVDHSLQAFGAGHSDSWSARIDSRLGVQLSATFSEKLTGVVQVISEQTSDGDYRPHVEWANLRLQVTPALDVRLGRTVLDSFLVSDYRKVGYVNPWVRPPVELYTMVPVTNSDGVDATYRREFGAASHVFRAHLGQSDARLPDVGGPRDVRVNDGWGVSDTIEYGTLTLHASFLQADMTLDSFNALFDGFRQFGPAGVALAERYDADGTRLWFAGLGGIYDPGDWFLQGEWGTFNAHSAIGDRTAWYLSTGYRWAQFTPYATYARTVADTARTDPGLNPDLFPAEHAPTIAALNAGLNDALGAVPLQRTVSLGVRWDVVRNVALKLQVDHSELGADSAGTLVNRQPGFVPGGRFNLLSVSADVVF